MICKKTLKIAMGVGIVLSATASFAATTESFEDSTVGANVWYGDGGSFSNETVAVDAVGAVGFPITNVNHDTVYFVEGEVICSNVVNSATSSISDFLINIAECSDELGDDDLTGAKIAIAAGPTNLLSSADYSAGGKIPLCIYCTTNGGNVGWASIKVVNEGAWLRVTLAFTNGFCRVSLNGEPVKNAIGYTSASDSASRNGAWYKLAGGSGNNVQSLAFIGCAKLDDVVIKDSFAEDAFPATAVATLTGDETVRYNDLNKWGWTVTDLQGKLGDTVPGTDMTVAQKLLCGLDPTTTTKFEPLTITPTGANTANITFPCEDASKKTRYSLGYEGGTAVFTGGASSITVENGVATAGITLAPAQGSKVVKFWLVATR